MAIYDRATRQFNGSLTRLLTQVTLLAAVLLLLPAAWAQDARGTVLGRVMDATGAMIPGAEVRIANEATGVVATARTNDAGSFILPYLIPGTYQLTCEMQGFKRYLFPGIQVNALKSF